MDINKNNRITWLIMATVILFLTIIVFEVNGNTWAAQVLAACLGAIITIIATRFLLKEQSNIELKQALEQSKIEFQQALEQSRIDFEQTIKLREAEDKSKRELELYNAKLKVYSEFVSNMYEILRDNKITGDEFLDLRTRIFGQLSFYASGDILESINDLLKKVKNYKDPLQMQPQFVEIARVLQMDLRKDWPINKNSASDLWYTFDGLLDNGNSSDEDVININSDDLTHNAMDSVVANDSPDFLKKCFWHFAMWGAEQLTSLSEGNYELNLVEYNEEWRTNLMRQVKKDDLIFLFRSGGPGYMGVYRALGWRIFEFKENDECLETLYYFGRNELEISDKERIEKDLLRSDIYESREDGATLCSSLIVEPLAFASRGIGNPGGTYRRTISRYDRGYGFLQLARFMAIMDDNNVYNIFDNKPMGCNKELFKQILESGNITPAPRDDKGNWIN